MWIEVAREFFGFREQWSEMRASAPDPTVLVNGGMSNQKPPMGGWMTESFLLSFMQICTIDFKRAFCVCICQRCSRCVLASGEDGACDNSPSFLVSIDAFYVSTENDWFCSADPPARGSNQNSSLIDSLRGSRKALMDLIWHVYSKTSFWSPLQRKQGCVFTRC